MRFDLHFRREVTGQVEGLAAQMADWEIQPRVTENEGKHILRGLTPFEHTTRRDDLVIAGVDGSGDYPALSYADSFVYLATAQATTYKSQQTCGLREVDPPSPPLVDFVWLPEEQERRCSNLDAAFTRLAGASLETVIAESDYLQLKERHAGHRQSASAAVAGLIRPHASDSGNVSIQLRSTAELSAALRQLECLPEGAYLFVDGTLSLPFVGRKDLSLFHEHVKRLCCVKARERGVCFMALSKSHGLPGIEILEELARERCGLTGHEVAVHWYLRIPSQSIDSWRLSLARDRLIPPVGAVTYLVRFHKTVPILRLDMDATYWTENILGADDKETRANERRLFGDLDYASHDQRCYGYPYPIKAAHDRASITQAERTSMRKQVIDAAVHAGMRRSLFRDTSPPTGHR